MWLQSRWWLGPHQKARLEPGDPLPSSFYTCNCLEKALFLHHVEFSIGYLNVLMTCLLVSPNASDLREEWKLQCLS